MSVINWINQIDLFRQASAECNFPGSREDFITLVRVLKQSGVKELGDLEQVIGGIHRAFEFFDRLMTLDFKLANEIPLDDQKHEMTVVGEKLCYDMSQAVHFAHGILEIQRSKQGHTQIFKTLNGIVGNLIDFVDGVCRDSLPEPARDELDADGDRYVALKTGDLDMLISSN